MNATARRMTYCDVLIGWKFGSWEEKLALLRECWTMGDVTELHTPEQCERKAK
jgi:hypothetical protein